MDGEITTFVMVWASILISAFYCYAVVKIVAKGFLRLILFLPVVCLFVVLPFNLTSVHLGCSTVFFISWLANFKLLLLASGNGPLSDPSLTMPSFVLIACLPIKLQENKSFKQPENEGKGLQVNGRRNHHQVRLAPKYCNTSNLRNPSHFAKNALILVTLVLLGQWREHLNPTIFLFCVTLHLYVGLDLMLSIMGLICEVLLGIELEAPFHDPFLSTSLRNFWGRRWNKIASDNLRSSVYFPIYHYSSQKIGHHWALTQALLGTFFVSAIMHELLMYHLRRTKPTFRTTMFFLFHGLCLVFEDKMKNRFTGKWPFSQLITGPLIFGFVILTAMWLLIPDALDYKVDARVLDECSALGAFLKNLGVVLVRKLAP